jgi:hypothetical protein
MASVSRPYRLMNPGRRRKKNSSGKRMSLAQKLHFGTKRQRAAAKASLGRKKSNPRKRRYTKGTGLNTVSKLLKAWRAKASKRKRKNVGEILTVFNPGTRRGKRTNNMARRRKRNSLFGRRRRRSNPVAYRRRRRVRRSNPVARRVHRRRRYAPIARRRRSNPGVRRYRRMGRRRNPDFLSGEAGVIVGVVGGATVTNLLMGTLQSTVSAVSSGIPAYVAGAIVAFLQGKLVGKFTKNPALGKYMAAGGYTWVALTMLKDFLPSFPNPFSNLSGMGLLTTSNNWGPLWSNVGNSMTRFQ